MCGKRDFPDVTKIRNLRWEITQDYPYGFNIITAVLLRGRRRVKRSKRRFEDNPRGGSDVLRGWRMNQEPR